MFPISPLLLFVSLPTSYFLFPHFFRLALPTLYFTHLVSLLSHCPTRVLIHHRYPTPTCPATLLPSGVALPVATSPSLLTSQIHVGYRPRCPPTPCWPQQPRSSPCTTAQSHPRRPRSRSFPKGACRGDHGDAASLPPLPTQHNTARLAAPRS